MNTYPYISKSGNINGYLILNESKVWSFQNEEWIIFGTREFKNDTLEFLANTYGEVKSKEHAEFIVKLAKAHDVEVCVFWRKGKFFNFYTDSNGYLYLDFFDKKTAKDSGERLITIPLPPKSNVNTPEEDFEMQQIEKNNGDNLMFGCADKCKEWPCVGDEVMFNDLLQHYDQYKEYYCGKPSKVIARFNTTEGEFITVHREYCAVMTVRIDRVLKDGALIKPKTPEEELRDDIFQSSGVRARDGGNQMASDISKYLLSKYNITKKPQ